MPQHDAPDVEAALDELYGAPPDEFLAVRSALERKFRDAGYRDAASELHHRRRPNLAAWATNQVARRNAATDRAGAAKAAAADQARAEREARAAALRLQEAEDALAKARTAARDAEKQVRAARTAATRAERAAEKAANQLARLESHDVE